MYERDHCREDSPVRGRGSGFNIATGSKNSFLSEGSRSPHKRRLPAFDDAPKETVLLRV